MNEIWKDIEGFEGFYKVSTFGNVFSVRRNKNLKQSRIGGGYLKVSLCVDNKKIDKLVHALVLDTFTGEKLNGRHRHHVDNDISNNHLNNLEYIDKSSHRNLHRFRGFYNKSKIVQICGKTGEKLNIFNTKAEAARFLKVSPRAIGAAVTGEHKTCKGFILESETVCS